MEKKILMGGALSTLIAATAVAGSVSAATVAEATDLTEEEVMEVALSAVSTEVDDAEDAAEDGRRVYEIVIVMDDGTTIEVEVDAETGALLEVAEYEDDDLDCSSDDDDDDDLDNSSDDD